MNNPKKFYERRIHHLDSLLSKQTKASIAWMKMRVVTFVVTIVLFFLFYITNNNYLAIGFTLVGLIAFFIMVGRHSNLKKNIQRVEVLRGINESAFNRLSDLWSSFADDGREFMEESHPYAGDLDLFGKASLFQWMNQGRTQVGRRLLARELSNPHQNHKLLLKRQNAAKELAGHILFRQRFLAEGEMMNEQDQQVEELFSWATQRVDFYHRKPLKAVVNVAPLLTIGLLLLSFFTDAFPALQLFGGAAFLQFLFLRYRLQERNQMLESIFKNQKALRVYGKMLSLLENQNLQNEYLKELIQSLMTEQQKTASEQIKKLASISDGISSRSNMLYVVVNVLFLADYRSMIALELWKEETGNLLRTWIETIGQIEYLNSLASLYGDFPHYCTPRIDGNKELIAEAMGHPLLRTDRITNSVSLKSPGDILLITGSNMSGKSTLLRTVGINLILAYIGAPVCACSFSAGYYKIFTCMRTGDNLEARVSSFYAEILRIKSIVEASEKGENILFLLDEIFKGTNSYDRHIGAKMLIKQLAAKGCIGLVSTHDLELKDLEEEMDGRVCNYHFREYYEGNEIRFDYKLRKGVSTTRNALYLIQMAGIHVDENDKIGDKHV